MCLQTENESYKLQKTSSSPFAETLAYDSVWTLALALNRTMNMINTNDTLDCGPSPVPLEEFSYGNSSTACLIRHSLSNTNFTGLSVSLLLFFDVLGDYKYTKPLLVCYTGALLWAFIDIILYHQVFKLYNKLTARGCLERQL